VIIVMVLLLQAVMCLVMAILAGYFLSKTNTGDEIYSYIYQSPS
jgi:uncharacterized protein YneF (UPF0154 family)